MCVYWVVQARKSTSFFFLSSRDHKWLMSTELNLSVYFIFIFIFIFCSRWNSTRPIFDFKMHLILDRIYQLQGRPEHHKKVPTWSLDAHACSHFMLDFKQTKPLNVFFHTLAFEFKGWVPEWFSIKQMVYSWWPVILLIETMLHELN